MGQNNNMPARGRLALIIVAGLGLIVTGAALAAGVFAISHRLADQVVTRTAVAKSSITDKTAAPSPTRSEASTYPTPFPSSTLTPLPSSTPVPSSTTTPTPSHSPTPSLTPIPTLGIGSIMASETDGMVLAYVPAGEFQMGSASSDSQARDDEKPQHTVYLDAFWIDKTEVTNAMYALCVKDRACQEPSSVKSYTRRSYYGDSQYAGYPVIHVSWGDAVVYCVWAGRRLPTEAQWEKAARGTDGRLYPWGNTLSGANRLNFNQYGGDTTAVGSYPSGASPFGALDMAGNVSEWVADWYSYVFYSFSPASNPSGPTNGVSRVVRGGSWHSYIENVRAASRGTAFPTAGFNYGLGFRCACSP